MLVAPMIIVFWFRIHLPFSKNIILLPSSPSSASHLSLAVCFRVGQLLINLLGFVVQKYSGFRSYE